MLAPNGVEEERGPGYVEYAIYGGEGELPELGEIDAAVGEGRVEVSSTEIPDDWADRWRDFHKPLLVGERLWLRPSWEPPREGAIDVVVDPGQAFGTGAHPTTRLCLELLLELEAAGEAGGPLTDLGTGSGVLAIAAAKLGWGPIRALRPRAAGARGGSRQRRGQRRRARLAAHQPARTPPGARPHRRRQHDRADPAAVAVQLAARSGEGSRSLPAVAPEPSPVSHHPRLLRASCQPSWTRSRRPSPRPASTEVERRQEGDWAALLLRRG